MVCDACLGPVHKITSFALAHDEEGDFSASDVKKDNAPSREDLKDESSPEEFERSLTLGCFPCNELGEEVGERDDDALIKRRVTGVDDDDHIKLSLTYHRNTDFDVPETVTCRFTVDLSSDTHRKNELAEYTGDAHVLDLGLEWLRDCRANHRQCGNFGKFSDWRPPRLVEIDPLSLGVGFWRAAKVSDIDLVEPYVTLSHRCVLETPKLVQDTQREMEAGMPISSLSKTYVDAMTVARHLGVRYIWIDSLCIFQDEGINIREAAMKVAEVYSNALLNISALTASSEGIFRRRSSSFTRSCAVERPGRGDYL
ncbi:uncharacterized protein PV07_12114 [Cladophialophora immunda]|uniref:Heterokaryon incompatibility domain-containing protein n=1 Tax=Cladophialophora immunda TaxID=569365 RepID=A0A0D2BT18_9EURO|nr:uncharacterized protein PV07_12114 [Cladophialophora immunda]KIW22203.1 hypothetical protein PV07_12114 [Cladophialophora immunda]